MTRLALTLAALLALAACTTGRMAAPAAPPDPRTQMAALETRIAILVEEQRRKLGTRPLAIDGELSKVARARAADMAAKDYLAHAAPNGDTSASLLMKQDAKWQGLLGENLAAQHYTRQAGVSVNEFAQRFLDEWLKSPPHKENMAFARYDHAGIGAAVNEDTVYVALLFSTTMGLPPLTDAQVSGEVTKFDSAAAATAEPAAPQPDPLRLRGAVGGIAQ